MAKWSKGAWLDDIQVFHIRALESIACAYALVKQQALTEMDIRAMVELDDAAGNIRQAKRLIAQEHPNGRKHDANTGNH